MSAQTVSNAVANRDEQVGPIKFMWSKRSHLATVLPASIDVEMFLGTAAGALYANKTLMDYATTNPESLMIALLECATLGHRPGTDEYYLTPRKDHGRGKVLGIEGYKGVIERFYRSGAVGNVIVREVCADDPFQYREGIDRVPVHEVGGRGRTGADFFGADGGRKRGAMVGAYAYAELLTGSVSRVVILRRKDVLAARDAGGYKPADPYSPWNRMDAGPDEPEFQGRSMWWKTAAKRLEPWVPTSSEYRREQLRASAAAVNAAPRAMSLPPSDAVAGAGDVVDAEVVEDAPAAVEAAPADSPAMKMAQAQGSRIFKGDRDARLEWAGRVLRLDAPLKSFSHLTEAELVTVGETFAKCRDLDALKVLLEDGTAPGE
jgi:recombination protein RecT